jgi:hypothetical protein
MQTYKRNGNKWSVNELLQLQRDYELLELNIQEIAVKHERSVEAILYKLEAEGFIESWNEARGLSEWQNNKSYDSDEVQSITQNNTEVASDVSYEIENLTERVWSLETSVGEIRTMVKQMFDKMVVTNTKKRTKLRSY